MSKKKIKYRLGYGLLGQIFVVFGYRVSSLHLKTLDLHPNPLICYEL